MFTALLGPALSFGSSLISGLGARQSAKKQQKIQAAYEYMNFVNRQADIVTNRTWTNWKNDQDAALGTQLQGRADAMRDAWNPANIPAHAAAAGFNPATWLSMMGGAYAANSQAAESMWATGLSMKSPQIYLDAAYEQNAPTTQVPSVTEAVGGALQAGVNTLLTDWRAIDSRNFQREQLATQIAAIQANGGKAKSALGVPVSQRSFFGSGQIPYAVAAASQALSTSSKGAAALPSGQSVLVGDEVKNPSPFQVQGWYSQPKLPGAQAVGDAYHEEGPIVWLYGNVVKPFADAKYNWDINKHIGFDLMGVRVSPADRNQTGFYPDGARGVTWGSKTPWPQGPGESFQMPYTASWF